MKTIIMPSNSIMLSLLCLLECFAIPDVGRIRLRYRGKRISFQTDDTGPRRVSQRPEAHCQAGAQRKIVNRPDGAGTRHLRALEWNVSHVRRSSFCFLSVLPESSCWGISLRDNLLQ